VTYGESTRQGRGGRHSSERWVDGEEAKTLSGQWNSSAVSYVRWLSLLCGAPIALGRKGEGETWINLKDGAWEATLTKERAAAVLQRNSDDGGGLPSLRADNMVDEVCSGWTSGQVRGKVKKAAMAAFQVPGGGGSGTGTMEARRCTCVEQGKGLLMGGPHTVAAQGAGTWASTQSGEVEPVPWREAVDESACAYD
jgi:hypothetical protein